MSRAPTMQKKGPDVGKEAINHCYLLVKEKQEVQQRKNITRGNIHGAKVWGLVRTAECPGQEGCGHVDQIADNHGGNSQRS